MMRTREGVPEEGPPRPTPRTMGDEEIEGAVQADSDQAAAEMEAAAEQATPPAVELITPDTLDTVAAVLPDAIARLTDDQVTVSLPEMFEESEKVPAAISKWVLGVGALAAKHGPGMKALQAYAFDPMEALKSNDALVEAVMKIDRMSRDPKVLKALATGAPAPAAPEGQPKPTKLSTEEGL